MLRKVILSAGALLAGTALPALAQPPAQLPPTGVPAPPGGSAVPGSQPDPAALYPLIRPTDGHPPVPPCPTCEPPTQNLWNRPTLTGDWGGLRPRLQERGSRSRAT